MATYSFISKPRDNQQIVRGDQPNKYVKRGGDSLDGSLTDVDTLEFNTSYTPTGSEPVGTVYFDSQQNCFVINGLVQASIAGQTFTYFV